MKLGVSVASTAMRGEPPGAATGLRSDMATVAMQALGAGGELDGGAARYGARSLRPPASLKLGAAPLGLA